MINQTIAPLQPYVAYPKALTPEQCDHIIAIGNAIGFGKAVTMGGPPEHRSSKTAWIHNQDGVAFLFDKLQELAVVTHARWFPCTTTHFAEPIQIAKYESAEKDFYDWHPDLGDGATRTRKLSVAILLSEPGTFEGGGLEIFGTPPVPVSQNERGTAIVFPSYTYHRVLPVTQGVRHSAVCWLHGPVWS